MEGLHERTKKRAFNRGVFDAENARPAYSESRSGSIWDAEYHKGYKKGLTSKNAQKES